MRFKEPDELKELIPLYLQGRLTRREREEFEEALRRYPDLQRELKEFEEISDVLRDLEKEVPPLDAEWVFRKTLQRIRNDGVIAKDPLLKRLTALLRGLFTSYRLSWGIVAVQCIIILLLVSRIPQNLPYKTLTTQSPQVTSGVRVNVVFKADARVEDVRRLLREVGATIVWGPSQEGLYIIKIERSKELKSILERLRDSPIVEFAERAY